MPLVAGNKNWMALVAGINTDYLVAREWQMASGRLFTSAEMDSAAKVAIVGTVIVEALFEGRAGVGETFRIGNIPFTVIGVLDKKGLGAAGRSQDDIVFIPLSTAKSRVLGAVRGTTREALDFISIKVSDADAMPTVTDEIEKLLAHGRGSQAPRHPMAVPDRGLNAGIAGRTRRRTIGSDGRRRDRMGGWLADTDKPLGHYTGLWICRVCGDFIWPLSSPSGSAARSDRGIAL
jgi:hypothetical protein